MSITNNHRMISYLYRQDVSPAIIKILEEQRINDDDLQTIDRDDIEHLFKNESGFTFRDRKKLWNSIQKFRSIGTQTDVIYIEPDNDHSSMYNTMNDETLNYRLAPHYVPVGSSNISPTLEIYSSHNNMIHGSLLELSNSEGDHDDNPKPATTSLPARTKSGQTPKLKKSLDIKCPYSYDLPTFSPKIMRAFELNDIESEWSALITELAHWILSKKPTPMLKGEYQAIGQTVYQHYPSVARDGYRPWSHLCKCLTQKIRRIVQKRLET